MASTGIYLFERLAGQTCFVARHLEGKEIPIDRPRSFLSMHQELNGGRGTNIDAMAGFDFERDLKR